MYFVECVMGFFHLWEIMFGWFIAIRCVGESKVMSYMKWIDLWVISEIAWCLHCRYVHHTSNVHNIHLFIRLTEDIQSLSLLLNLSELHTFSYLLLRINQIELFMNDRLWSCLQHYFFSDWSDWKARKHCCSYAMQHSTCFEIGQTWFWPTWFAQFHMYHVIAKSLTHRSTWWRSIPSWARWRTGCSRPWPWSSGTPRRRRSSNGGLV